MNDDLRKLSFLMFNNRIIILYFDIKIAIIMAISDRPWAMPGSKTIGNYIIGTS